MIDQDTLHAATAKIVATENVGTFIKLDNSYHLLTANDGTPEEMISRFYQNCRELITEEEHNPVTRIMAYSKLLSIEADLLLHELTNNYSFTLGRKKDVLRDTINRDWEVFDRQLRTQYKTLTDFAFKKYDFLAINNLMMDQVEWDYEQAFHFYAFENWSPETFKVEGPINAQTRKRLEKGMIMVDKVEEAYERLMHIENLYACLMFKYQLLDFMGEAQKAASIADKLEKLIDTYELNALRKGYADLMAGKTKHQVFFEKVTDKMTNIYEVVKSADIVRRCNGGAEQVIQTGTAVVT